MCFKMMFREGNASVTAAQACATKLIELASPPLFYFSSSFTLDSSSPPSPWIPPPSPSSHPLLTTISSSNPLIKSNKLIN